MVRSLRFGHDTQFCIPNGRLLEFTFPKWLINGLRVIKISRNKGLLLYGHFQYDCRGIRRYNCRIFHMNETLI